MATAAQPILNGTTYPHVSAWRVSTTFRGAGVQMANGDLRWGLVNQNRKNIHTLEWNKFSETDYTNLKTDWLTMNDTSVAFTDPAGTATTVLRDPNNTNLEVEAYIDASNEIYYRVSISLWEV